MILGKIVAKKSTMTTIKLCVILLISISMIGCSIIGLTLGGSIDAMKSRKFMVTCCSVNSLEPGTSLKVFLKEGFQSCGKFIKLDAVPSNQYLNRYSVFQDKHQFFMDSFHSYTLFSSFFTIPLIIAAIILNAATIIRGINHQ